MISLGRTRHVARKAHRCESCGTKIWPGEPYNRARVVDCGDAWVWKAHTYCDAASEILWSLGIRGEDDTLLAVSDFDSEDFGAVMIDAPEVWQAVIGGCR